MRVLLTGVTGRIGEPVLLTLADAGHTVHVMTRSPLSAASEGAAAEVARGDVMDYDAWVSALNGVEAVVHLAGVSHERPEAMVVNVSSTEAMVGACHEAGVGRIVLASSNCVLGHCDRPDDQPFPFRYLPIDESHETDHVTDYGRSKLAAEKVLRAAARRWSLKALALRPAWVWREEELHRRRSASWPEADHAPSLWAYVHVLDLAEAVLAALASDGGGLFQAFYLSAADTTADAPTEDLVRRYYPQLVGSARKLVGHASLFSSQSATANMGYHPRISWRD